MSAGCNAGRGGRSDCLEDHQGGVVLQDRVLADPFHEPVEHRLGGEMAEGAGEVRQLVLPQGGAFGVRIGDPVGEAEDQVPGVQANDVDRVADIRQDPEQQTRHLEPLDLPVLADEEGGG